MSGYLSKSKDLDEVASLEVRYLLLFANLVCQRLLLPIPTHLQCNLPDVCCYELTLDPLEGGVQTREMASEHEVSMPKEVSIAQRRGGSRHGQCRLVIASILGRGDENPVDFRATINF